MSPDPDWTPWRIDWGLNRRLMISGLFNELRKEFRIETMLDVLPSISLRGALIWLDKVKDLQKEERRRSLVYSLGKVLGDLL
jgi:hypothetical protein